MKPMMLLLFAIITEVIGTTALKLSDGFTKPVPSLFVVAGYGASFYLLALALRSCPSASPMPFGLVWDWS